MTITANELRQMITRYDDLCNDSHSCVRSVEAQAWLETCERRIDETVKKLDQGVSKRNKGLQEELAQAYTRLQRRMQAVGAKLGDMRNNEMPKERHLRAL